MGRNTAPKVEACSDPQREEPQHIPAVFGPGGQTVFLQQSVFPDEQKHQHRNHDQTDHHVGTVVPEIAQIAHGDRVENDPEDGKKDFTPIIKFFHRFPPD